MTINAIERCKARIGRTGNHLATGTASVQDQQDWCGENGEGVAKSIDPCSVRQQEYEEDGNDTADNERGSDWANGDKERRIERINVGGEPADQVAMPHIAVSERQAGKEASK